MKAFLRKLGAAIGRGVIAGAVVGLPTYAAGAEGRELVVAFATPFVGVLAVAFNVQVQSIMGVQPKTGVN